MTDVVLQKTIFLRASPAQVWAYLTDPEKLAIWWMRPTAPLVEGDYEMIGAESGDTIISGTVLVAEPFNRLDYTFTIAPMAGKISTVKWVLTQVADGTQLSLHHTGLPQGADAFGLILALDEGWDKHLARLRSDANADV